MAFSEIYADEVLESRRTRSQRARFWARVVSLLLMVMVAVTLRSEPDLRRAIVEAAIAAGMQATGRSAPDGLSAPPQAAASGGLRDRVRVNRGTAGPRPRATRRPDAQAVADGVQDRLTGLGLRGS